MATPRKSTATLATVAAAGDRAKTLEAARDRLARAIDACESDRDLAALTARFLDVLAQLAALPTATKGTAVDELKARRARSGRPTERKSRSAG